MAEQELTEEEKLKQLAKKMREEEYKGLTEEEIKEKEQQKEMKRQRNIQILDDTLDIIEKGSYIKDNQEVQLHSSYEDLKKIQVFLPDDIDSLSKIERKNNTNCTYNCENVDALTLAKNINQNLDNHDKVLVLNLASATEPGGRTRKGASAQEENLCQRTSLLLSLESDDAKKYYEYNKSLKTRMGSNAIMISPNVEVIKDTSFALLDEPFEIAVMSCGAPMIRLGLEGMSQEEYEALLYKRIQGMLVVAASQNYHHLILGAFGCGVYGNDAAIVSDMFYKVIQDFNSNQIFESIDFAVLCNPKKDYNYQEFSRNFKALG
ncbi:MAG: TIGR02452 family protein [Erysipelotrichaceae bacterium]|nr:TIGR02452 family protein [Erysipelotrichaceae bacterium]